MYLVPCFTCRYVQRHFLLITTDLQYFQNSISDLVKQLLYCGRAEVSRPLDGDMAAVAVMAALLLLALMAEVGGDTPGDMFPRYQPLLL